MRAELDPIDHTKAWRKIRDLHVVMLSPPL